MFHFGKSRRLQPGGRGRWYGSGRKLLDIDSRRPALALPDTLDQPDPSASVQFRKQPDGLSVAAKQRLLYLVQRIVYINTPLLIVPAVFHGQAHAVKQEAIQQLGVRGQVFEIATGHKLPGDAVKGKLLALAAIVIIEKGLFLHACTSFRGMKKGRSENSERP